MAVAQTHKSTLPEPHPHVACTAFGDSTPLTARSLNVAYGGTQVLHDVSINIPDRQVTAIMGPSGCGKSTLIKTLNRTLELQREARITGGCVCYRNRDLYGKDVDPRAVRKRLGIIQQTPQPFPMSIAENVLFGVRFHRRLDHSGRVGVLEEYLTKTGLWAEVKDRLKRPARGLSGGQQQRLCLARALANEPDVLLMDEPCSALDPASTERIENLIADLRGELPIVIVTHNLAQARRVADHVALLHDGEVAEAGLARDFFSSPSTSVGVDFLEGRID